MDNQSYNIPLSALINIETNIDNEQYVYTYEKLDIAKNAIYHNKFSLYEKIVETIDNFDIRFESDTLLVAACLSRNIDLVQYFIDRQLDVTISDNYIICNCIESPKYNEVLKLIINHGADVNAGNGEVLVNAINLPSVKIFETLIKNGADYTLNNYEAVVESSMNYKCTYHRSFSSTEEDSDEEVLTNNFLSYFISEGIDVDLDNGKLLKSAMEYKLEENIKLLLKNGANITLLEFKDLFSIVKNMEIDIIEILIDYGIDFSILNSYENIQLKSLFTNSMSYIIYDVTYIIYDATYVRFDFDIAYCNKIEMQIYSIKRSYINLPVENNNYDALKTLIAKNDLQMFEKILDDSNIDIRFDNDVLLAVAVIHNNIDMVKYLLDKGLDIHSNDDFAIKISCITNTDGAILRLFIDEYKIDTSNNEFIDIALEKKMEVCVKMLVQHGANVFFDDGVRFIDFINIKNDSFFDNLLLEINDYDLLLQRAIKRGLYRSTELLLKYGANIKIIEVTHLFNVIRYKNIIFLKMLISCGFDLNVLNMYQPSDESINFVSKLLNAGLDSQVLMQILYTT